MLYIHYCGICKRLHILSGHKLDCPKCRQSIYELKIKYSDYTRLSQHERDLLTWKLSNDAILKQYTKHYRFAIHTKRYKNLSQVPDNF